MAFAVPVGKKGDTRLAVRVDEPRRDRLVRRVDRLPRPSSRQIADGDDAIALDADVGAPAGARSVVDGAAAHDEIELGRGGTCRHRRGGDRQRKEDDGAWHQRRFYMHGTKEH